MLYGTDELEACLIGLALLIILPLHPDIAAWGSLQTETTWEHNTTHIKTRILIGLIHTMLIVHTAISLQCNYIPCTFTFL